jgi:cell division protein FtsB
MLKDQVSQNEQMRQDLQRLRTDNEDLAQERRSLMQMVDDLEGRVNGE